MRTAASAAEGVIKLTDREDKINEYFWIYRNGKHGTRDVKRDYEEF